MIIIIIIIIANNSEKKTKCNCKPVKNAIRKCCCTKWMEKTFKDKRLILMLKTILNRNVIYYMQQLSQISSGGPYMILFSTFIQVFNCSFVANTNYDEADAS